MATFDQLADEATITKTVEALQKNGINVVVVENGEEAKKKVLEILPKDAEVLTMTSVTLDTLGLSKHVNEVGDHDSVRNKLNALDRNTDGAEMQKIGAAPEWVMGSVHAITEDGHVFIASNTGSQLPAYSYGSGHVIWVVGTQKLVKNNDDAFKRLYDYVLPIETVRARKAYGLPDTWDSYISKLLIVNREVTPNRITVVLVKEKLGF